MEGNIYNHIIYVLINPRSNYNYVSPILVEKCQLDKEAHEESWLVHLAIGTNIRVEYRVRDFPIELNDISTIVNLNMFPLGVNNIIYGMVGCTCITPR